MPSDDIDFLGIGLNITRQLARSYIKDAIIPTEKKVVQLVYALAVILSLAVPGAFYLGSHPKDQARILNAPGVRTAFYQVNNRLPKNIRLPDPYFVGPMLPKPEESLGLVSLESRLSRLD